MKLVEETLLETLYERCDYYQKLYEETGDPKDRERFIELFEAIEYSNLIMAYVECEEN